MSMIPKKDRELCQTYCRTSTILQRPLEKHPAMLPSLLCRAAVGHFSTLFGLTVLKVKSLIILNVGVSMTLRNLKSGVPLVVKNIILKR